VSAIKRKKNNSIYILLPKQEKSFNISYNKEYNNNYNIKNNAMAHPRKIKCDCGAYVEEQETKIDHILTKAMVCPKCHFTTLTKDQAIDFRKRIDFHKIVDQEKQIIQIGNSIGITLPEKLREHGLTVGKKIRIEALDEKSFKVELMN